MSGKIYFSLFVVLLLLSCNKPLPSLDGVDLEAWKKDKNGCSGYRLKVADTLQSQTEKIKALSEMEVVRLLGRPDQNELYRRNQKFFHYSLEPGGPCGADNKKPKRLSIRFNATERAKEVIIE